MKFKLKFYLAFLVWCFLLKICECQYNCKVDTPDNFFPHFPNFCRHRNPFSLLPEKLYYEFEAYGPNETLIESHYICESENPYSKCYSVLDLGYIEYNVHDRFLVYYLVTGYLVYSGYSSETLTTLHKISLTDDKFCINGSCYFDLYHASTDLAGVVFSEESTISFAQIYHNEGKLNFSVCGSIAYDMDLYDLEGIQTVKTPSIAETRVLLKFHSKSDPHLYVYDFYYFDYGCTVGTPINKEFTWTIRTSESRGATFLNHMVHTHDANFQTSDNSIFTKEVSQIKNVIFMFHDDYQVKIVPYVQSDYYFQFDFSLMSTFYEVTENDRTITTVAVIMEEIRRVDFGSSCGSYSESCLSETVFLSIGEYIPSIKATNVSTIELMEFCKQSFTQPINRTNYAHRYRYCKNGYFDGSQCHSRYTLHNLLHYGEFYHSKSVFSNTFYNASFPDAYDGSYLRILDIDSICAYYLAHPEYDLDLIGDCHDYRDSTYGNCDVAKLMDSKSIRGMILTNLWHHTIFFVSKTNRTVYSTSFGRNVDENTMEYIPNSFYHRPTGSITTAGDIIQVQHSRNSFYLLFLISKAKWQLDSQKKEVDACKEILSDGFESLFKNIEEYIPGEDILPRMKLACAITPPVLPSFNEFIQFLSACPKGTWCPSMHNSILDIIEKGHYSQRPFLKAPCPKGHYCVDGMKFDCPHGARCPDPGMHIPIVCERSWNKWFSCYNPKNTIPLISDPHKVAVVEEMFAPILRGVHVCPIGHICTDPYDPPISIPPGHKQHLPVEVLERSQGDLNVTALLMYIIDQVLYLDNHFVECEKDEWCPLRMFWAQEIPTGLFCNKSCVIPELCPAGKFCQTPSDMEVCWTRHYCPDGSIMPKKCSLLSLGCEPGSKSQGSDMFTFIGIFSLLVGLYLLSVLIHKVYFYYLELTYPRKAYTSFLKICRETVNPDMFIDLAFEDLSLRLRSNGKKVVNNVTGIFRKGCTTAVMGVSGCGKTSIITALAGKAYYGFVTGNIYTNGVPAKLKKYKKLIGFVPQEDIMYRNMTVFETLYFCARTRGNSKKSREQIKNQVSNIITVLGLDDIKNSVIGDENKRGISGGQRKRVNIGMELVAEPLVLFLDEPTSGLDSACSQEVMNVLKIISNTGINVITVIHQPRYEIFKKFENLLLLGKGGYVIYCGPVTEVEAYFGKLGFVCPARINPADYFLDVVSGRVANSSHKKRKQDFFVEHWKKHNEPIIKQRIEEAKPTKVGDIELVKSGMDHQKSLRKRNFFTQLVESLKRATLMRIRNLKSIYIDILLIIIGALILGTVYSAYSVDPNDLFKKSTMIVLILCLTAVMSALSTFGEEKAVFVRENDAGLMSVVHFISFNIVDLFNIIVLPFAFTCIYIFLAAPFASFWVLFPVGMSAHFCSYGLGYCTSLALGANARLGSIVLLCILFFFIGTVMDPATMYKEWPFPINYIMYADYLFYTLGAFLLSEVYAFKYSSPFFYVTTIKGLDEEMLMNETFYYWSVPALLISGFAFRIIAYLLLVSSPPDSFLKQTLNFFSNIFKNCVKGIDTSFTSFLKLTRQCRDKCIGKEGDPDLEVDELWVDEL